MNVLDIEKIDVSGFTARSFRNLCDGLLSDVGYTRVHYEPSVEGFSISRTPKGVTVCHYPDPFIENLSYGDILTGAAHEILGHLGNSKLEILEDTSTYRERLGVSEEDLRKMHSYYNVMEDSVVDTRTLRKYEYLREDNLRRYTGYLNEHLTTTNTSALEAASVVIAWITLQVWSAFLKENNLEELQTWMQANSYLFSQYIEKLPEGLYNFVYRSYFNELASTDRFGIEIDDKLTIHQSTFGWGIENACQRKRHLYWDGYRFLRFCQERDIAMGEAKPVLGLPKFWEEDEPSMREGYKALTPHLRQKAKAIRRQVEEVLAQSLYRREQRASRGTARGEAISEADLYRMDTDGRVLTVSNEIQTPNTHTQQVLIVDRSGSLWHESPPKLMCLDPFVYALYGVLLDMFDKKPLVIEFNNKAQVVKSLTENDLSAPNLGTDMNGAFETFWDMGGQLGPCRVWVITDGEFNTKVTWFDQLRTQGHKLIGIGIGPGTESIEKSLGNSGWHIKHFQALAPTLIRILNQTQGF